MRHSFLFTACCASLLAFTPMAASAASFVVDAQQHSISGGSGAGLDTGLTFTAGQSISVSSFVQDLWSAGALPRYSNGDGLISNRYANAADDSGVSPGTLIGTDFGLLTIGGFSAPYGALVGQFADGSFQLFGSNYNGTASGSGDLTLFYWDSNSADNFGNIRFDITSANAVPEPATWGMMLLGFGVLGALQRRRTKARLRPA